MCKIFIPNFLKFLLVFLLMIHKNKFYAFTKCAFSAKLMVRIEKSYLIISLKYFFPFTKCCQTILPLYKPCNLPVLLEGNKLLWRKKKSHFANAAWALMIALK